MSEMQNPIEESLREMITQYIAKRIELFKLETADVSARVLSLFLVYFLLMFVLFIAIIMLSMLAGILLSEKLKSSTIGFGIVSGVYLLSFLLMYVYRNTIAEKFLANQFIKSFFKEHDGNKNS
jgi:uncharacterized membrane protein YdjX (TVP38/TMEM64 family)